MNPLQRALIEKLGHDHGFEHVVHSNPDRVALASARHGARVEVSLHPEDRCFLVDVQAATPTLLPELRRSLSEAQWAHGFAASNEGQLAMLLRRTASLARALPCQAAQDFEAEVSCPSNFAFQAAAPMPPFRAEQPA